MNQLSVTEAGNLFEEKTLEEMKFGDSSPGMAGSSGKKSTSDVSLGTLQGVFLPCLQNILGVILFIRLPWITAQAGTWLTTVIIVSCAFITFLTSLSLSAIATNGKIAAGGPYYIVSRNLGKEVGASIGMLFYLGTTIAASMYALGAVEAFQKAFSLESQFTWDVQLQALALMLVLASIVVIGVKYVNMTAFVFLAAVLLSILAFTVGIITFGAGVESGMGDSLESKDREFNDNSGSSYQKDPDTGLTPTFVSLLALFFPSVTGIMAGTNRSAVLTDPGRSIPLGTLAAIVTTTIIYLVTTWLFGSIVSNATLKDNKLVVSAAALPHPMLVNVGIIMSSVGAGLQSLTGAPQLLNAIAQDGILPILSPFAAPPGEYPKRAVWLTWFIASLPCLAGNLDFINPIITMFFLLMYGTVNLSCFLLAVLRQPGFRPSWKFFHWSTALVGVLGCLTIMLLVSWIFAVVALFLVGILYAYASCTGATKNWGDARQGLRFQLARDALLALANGPQFHAKNWRPQVLTVVELDSGSGSPLSQQVQLLDLASQLKKGRGLTIVMGLMLGTDLPTIGPRLSSLNRRLQQHLARRRIQGFANVAAAASVQEGVWAAVQNPGLGPLRANMVLLSWPSPTRRMSLVGGDRGEPSVQEDGALSYWYQNPDAADQFVQTLRGVAAAKKSLLVLKTAAGATMPANNERLHGTIDIWWIVHDGGLLTLMAYLLSRHKVWRNCSLRLFSVASEADVQSTMKENLRRHMESVRIRASVNVVSLPSSEIMDWRQVAQRTLDMRERDELLRHLHLSNPTVTMALRGDAARKRPASGSQTSGADGVFSGGFFSHPDAGGEAVDVEAGEGGQGVEAAGEDKGATLSELVSDAPTTPTAPSREVTDAESEVKEETASATEAASGTASEAASEDDTAEEKAEVAKPARRGVRFATADNEEIVIPRASSAGSTAADVDAAVHDVAAEGVDAVADQSRLARVQAALRLNAHIKEQSGNASLVIMNLPLARTIPGHELMDYVELLTDGLKRVLLVRGSGREVVTSFG